MWSVRLRVVGNEKLYHHRQGALGVSHWSKNISVDWGTFSKADLVHSTWRYCPFATSFTLLKPVGLNKKNGIRKKICVDSSLTCDFVSGELGSLFGEVAENRVGNQNFNSGRGHAFFCLFPHWNWPWDSFSIPSGVLYSADVSCHGKWSIRYLMLCDHVSRSTVLGGLHLPHFLLNVMEGCSQILLC